MSTALELITALRDSLAAQYPTKVADQATRPGVVTASVAPERVQFEDIVCDPQPMFLTATVVVQAAAGGEQGVLDLLGHVDTVNGLIRAAGFTVVEWSPADVEDQPAVEITATANGTG
jgi:hypothetical protein